jgi:putative FmdB family regulatory protein
MPTYEYRCKKCGKQFEVTLRIERHERTKPKCPKCGSRSNEQLFSSFFAKTSSKS